MKFDIFFSICQTEVDGFMPDETSMWRNFFSQIELADELGYEVAWLAETHLSCETQKKSPQAVIPHFKGEIGLNTDVFQLAHKVFARTRHIEMGSAIRNILCNGGPIAHAESLRTFLSLHGLHPKEQRRFHLGFAAGRFDFSNRPYGIVPRSTLEEEIWLIMKGKIFKQATEIFLRLTRGDTISSQDLSPIVIHPRDFRKTDDFEKVKKKLSDHPEAQGGGWILPHFWDFETLSVIPKHIRHELLRLVVGSHDAETQIFANQFLPVGVFNLSITPGTVIEETHQRMLQHYHPRGGAWRRDYLPRTSMVFIDEDSLRARKRAEEAYRNYWKAMEGTLDQKKVDSAVANALVGSPQEIISQIRQKYQHQDRLMLWFDFNIHDNALIQKSMTQFMERVVPDFLVKD